MKNSIISLLLIFSGVHAISQTTNTFPSTGNVGIGTTSPDVALKVVRAGTNPGSEYSSINITTSGSGNLYGPILYLNATSGVGGRNWGIVSSGGMDAPATGASGNFAIYDAGGGSRLVINSIGNVGIGTTNPTTGLLVAQGLVTSQTATTLSAGNNDAFNLFAGGSGYAPGARQSILWSESGHTIGRFGTEYNHMRGQIDFVWRDQYNGGESAAESMRLTGEGNLGIGTTNPKNKLDVNGTIHSKEVKVDMLNWPDYVFAKEYDLPTLQATEKHIKEKGHLPGIPSAVEVKANGIDLGDMNAKLLQKIEELTLHLIEVKKENNQDKADIKELKQQLQQQDIKINLLINQLNNHN
jgi:hypothetical protein